jgi:hypothetical protein
MLVACQLTGLSALEARAMRGQRAYASAGKVVRMPALSSIRRKKSLGAVGGPRPTRKAAKAALEAAGPPNGGTVNAPSE